MASIPEIVEQIRSTASTFDNSRGTIEGEVNRMMNAVSGTTWTGQARQQFDTQWEEWRRRLAQMLNDLQTIANGLRTEANQLEEATRSFDR